jgi:hypothetical protein
MLESKTEFIGKAGDGHHLVVGRLPLSFMLSKACASHESILGKEVAQKVAFVQAIKR